MQVYDYGSDPDRAWIVMEFIDGGSLARLIKAGKPLPPRYAGELVRQVLDGLAASHASGSSTATSTPPT